MEIGAICQVFVFCFLFFAVGCRVRNKKLVACLTSAVGKGILAVEVVHCSISGIQEIPNFSSQNVSPLL